MPRPREERQGNRTVYVVAEGEGTEYDYLGRLNLAYGGRLKFLIQTPRASTQQNGLSPSRVVEEAANRLDDVDIDAVWALFDHDGRTDIDQVCAAGTRQDVKVALSHPSFELWLLLHFKEFSPAAQHGRNGLIIEKLRAAHPAFADYGRREKRINMPRFEALCEDDGIQRAVRRAQSIARTFGHCAPASRDPSTDVYRLIEDLGIVPRPR